MACSWEVLSHHSDLCLMAHCTHCKGWRRHSHLLSISTQFSSTFSSLQLFGKFTVASLRHQLKCLGYIAAQKAYSDMPRWAGKVAGEHRWGESGVVCLVGSHVLCEKDSPDSQPEVSLGKAVRLCCSRGPKTCYSATEWKLQREAGFAY